MPCLGTGDQSVPHTAAPLTVAEISNKKTTTTGDENANTSIELSQSFCKNNSLGYGNVSRKTYDIAADCQTHQSPWCGRDTANSSPAIHVDLTSNKLHPVSKSAQLTTRGANIQWKQ